MLGKLLKPIFEHFGRRYDYNVDYMMDMDKASPGTLSKIALLNPLSHHRKKAPLVAYHIAKVVSTRHHDCGPCLRLVCNMAQEEGVDRATLVAALQNPAQLQDDLALVAAYAEAVATQDQQKLGELRASMENSYSPGAITEISLAIAFGGFYPTMKRALGAATSCEPVLAELQADLVDAASAVTG